jgi:hypothetical protein
MKIKFARDGQEIGEYLEGEVAALLASNVLRATDLFWHDGLNGWTPVSSKWPVEITSLPPRLGEEGSGYKYKMVQVPPTIVVKDKNHRGSEAAAYLQQIVDQMAPQWEFYRVDPIGVQVQPGCLAGMFGAAVQERTYYVITFRRRA